MVFVDVRTVLFLTFVRYTRAHDFTQTIDIVTLQTEAFLDFLAHIVCPRFGTECTDTKSDVFLAQAHLVEGFGQVEGQGRKIFQGGLQKLPYSVCERCT